jgi:beta-glucosidase
MGDGAGAPAIMPDGVDISRMLDSFPIGRAAMFAAAGDVGVDLTALIDGLLSGESAADESLS